MADLNVCTFVGRLTREPELRYVGAKGTPVLNFAIANNTGFGQYEKTQFFECQLWGARGEGVKPYLFKGKQVGVTGQLEDNSWNRADGTRVLSYRLNCTELTLLADPKSAVPQQQTEQPPIYGDLPNAADITF